MSPKAFLPVLLVAPAALLGWYGSRVVSAKPDRPAVETSAQPKPPNLVQEAVWEDCRALYADITYDEAAKEVEAVRSVIREATNGYYASRFDRGAYRVIGRSEPGKPFDVPGNHDRLCSVRFSPDGEVGVVDLPEEEFPEVYELYYRAQWLVQKRESLAPPE